MCCATPQTSGASTPRVQLACRAGTAVLRGRLRPRAELGGALPRSHRWREGFSSGSSAMPHVPATPVPWFPSAASMVAGILPPMPTTPPARTPLSLTSAHRRHGQSRTKSCWNWNWTACAPLQGPWRPMGRRRTVRSLLCRRGLRTRLRLAARHVQQRQPRVRAERPWNRRSRRRPPLSERKWPLPPPRASTRSGRTLAPTRARDGRTARSAHTSGTCRPSLGDCGRRTRCRPISGRLTPLAPASELLWSQCRSASGGVASRHQD
mmetsp:Transcript_44786/g.129452  ORF Transcript_44786/g.129452 Transcript_44786/m.129452 type:complete len:265 (+) Transcript_44786:521-1315(+)